ncbi:MAG: VOC family protein [Candidatus Azambacteria bacterium]|nr:VOC family protein [Candidatus Azambacteria bacterium]
MKIRHSGVVVSNLEKSVNFYENLGLKVKARASESGEYLDKMLVKEGVVVTTVKMSAGNGSMLVELLKFHWPKAKLKKAPGPFEIGPTHIAFTVENLEAMYQKLLADGVHFNYPPITSPNGKVKVTFCEDPDGTLIELVEELKNELKGGKL